MKWPNLFIYALLSLLWTEKTSGQTISWRRYDGELGMSVGSASYIGQIGGEHSSYQRNFGLYYRKFLGNQFSVRINYEYIPLGANDTLSHDPQIKRRGFQFDRTFQDFNVQFEYCFNDFRLMTKDAYFTPYIGIGLGYMLNVPTYNNNFIQFNNLQDLYTAQYWPICSIPLSAGISYRFSNDYALFTEFSYRFTTSSKIDDFDGDAVVLTDHGNYTASNTKDRFFSFKIGVSKSFIKTYGLDKAKQYKRKK